jgi:hypothetical protein
MSTEDERAAAAQIQRALSRWEGEGGALRSGPQTESDETVVLAAAELRILQALGASVLLNWGTLPTATRKALFDGAVASGHPADRAAVKERIARFLHEHNEHKT